MQRNPVWADEALLLKLEQRLKGYYLPEVNVEVSRFTETDSNVSDWSRLMYDAGLTRLIMISLAALWLLPLDKPGEAGYH